MNKLSDEFIAAFGDPGLADWINRLRSPSLSYIVDDEALSFDYELRYHMDHDVPVLDSVHLVKDGKYSENIMGFAGKSQLDAWDEQLEEICYPPEELL